MVKISFYNQSDFPSLIKLLEISKLPTSDLQANLDNFVLVKDENKQVIAVGGIESYGKYGLLRSIAVHPDCQKEGWAKLIIQKLERAAQMEGIESLFLLTTTAEPYFKKLQYKTIERNNVPDAIKETSEFSSVCPSSATVMVKKLA